MLPDLNNCNYFKKSHIDYEGKDERVMIYRLKTSQDYTFLFKCPKCGKDNEFDDELKVRKARVDGKNKEYFFFGCKSCGTEFTIERLKAAGMKGRKPKA